MDDTVSLSCRYTAKAIEPAPRSHYISRAHVRLDIRVAVVVGVFGVYLQRSPSSHAFATFLVGAAEVFAWDTRYGSGHHSALAFSTHRSEVAWPWLLARLLRGTSTTEIDSKVQWICTRVSGSMLTVTCS